MIAFKTSAETAGVVRAEAKLTDCALKGKGAGAILQKLGCESTRKELQDEERVCLFLFR